MSNYYEWPDDLHFNECEDKAFENGGVCTCVELEEQRAEAATDRAIDERKERES